MVKIHEMIHLRLEALELPDEKLGLQLAGYWVLMHAENAGIDPLNISREATEVILEATKGLPDNHVRSELDSLLLAVRLAARGNFESAGKKLKAHIKSQAQHRVALDLASNMDDNARRGAKVRRAAKKGHEQVYGNPVEKRIRIDSYRLLLDEIRREHPSIKSNRKIYEIAEAFSEERFGKRVSYKAFERAEKKQNS